MGRVEMGRGEMGWVRLVGMRWVGDTLHMIHKLHTIYIPYTLHITYITCSL